MRRHIIADAIVAAFRAFCTREWHAEIQASPALLREHTGRTREVRITSRSSYLERTCTRCGRGIRVTMAMHRKVVA